VLRNAISNTLSHRDIVVETVFITDFKFSKAFADQIESKVVAFQKYLTEQNNLRVIQVIANLSHWKPYPSPIAMVGSFSRCYKLMSWVYFGA
jgi:hypothetical protein